MNKIKILIIALLPCLVLLATSCTPKPDYDTLIKNGKVIDGGGNPWFYADIGIKDGEIKSMGSLKNKSAFRVFDATGYYVVPGFIDPHSHAEGGLATPGLSHGRALLAQGITTVIINQCGGGPVDLKKQRKELMADGLGVNVGQLIAHGSIRRSIIGDADRKATPEELKKMVSVVREAMDYGAFGMSTGLFYPPGVYAPTSEIIELSNVVAEYNGIHQSHIRDESNYTIGVVASVEELIEISEASDATGIITHIKALGPPVWGKSKVIVDKINEARNNGLEIFTDQYPYKASATSLIAALIPTWATEGGTSELRKRLEDPELRDKILVETAENLQRRGGADRIQFRRFSEDPSIEGKTLKEVARARKLDPLDLTVKLIQKGSPSIVSFNMHEDDVKHFMIQPWNMTSSDGGLVEKGEGVPHPRNYGTFPRKIRKYVFEKKYQKPEEAIRCMTSLTSSVFGIFDRGILRPGFKADIAIFDPNIITDKATYTEPHQYAEGMVYVFVNGELAIDDGEFTGNLPGKVILKKH